MSVLDKVQVINNVLSVVVKVAEVMMKCIEYVIDVFDKE